MRKTLLLSFFSAAVVALAQNSAKPVHTPAAAPRPSSAAFAAMETINPERIRAHVRFLAADLLEGRGTGQRGGDIAAEYIATQFAIYGLKPAGDNGTYMQKVPMVGITPDAGDHLLAGALQRFRDEPEGSRRLRRLRPDRSSRSRTSMRPSSTSATASTRPSTTGTTTKVST